MIGTTASRPSARTGFADSLMLWIRCFAASLRRHSRIHESDQVRDRVIAENQVHCRRAIFVAMNGVKLFRQMRLEDARFRRARRTFPYCVPARLRRSPSTSRRGCARSPAPLRKRCLPTAILLSDACQKLAHADPARAAPARARLPDGENGSAAAPVPGDDTAPTLVSHTRGKMGW